MSSSGNPTANAAALAFPPEQDERRALVQRIALSRHFAKAHQLREILLYVVERALADPATPIHEQEIACSVLGRKPDLSPHEDNIVRVQVSHLRKRLGEYFGAEGRDESTRVLVPKGGYTLRFEQRAAPADIETEDVPAPLRHCQRRRHRNWRGLAAALLVIGIVTA